MKKGEDIANVKKQLLLNVFEILAQQGLISNEEKYRMKNIINEQRK